MKNLVMQTNTKYFFNIKNILFLKYNFVLSKQTKRIHFFLCNAWARLQSKNYKMLMTIVINSQFILFHIEQISIKLPRKKH